MGLGDIVNLKHNALMPYLPRLYNISYDKDYVIEYISYFKNITIINDIGERVEINNLSNYTLGKHSLQLNKEYIIIDVI